MHTEILVCKEQLYRYAKLLDVSPLLRGTHILEHAVSVICDYEQSRNLGHLLQIQISCYKIITLIRIRILLKCILVNIRHNENSFEQKLNIIMTDIRLL